MAKSGKHTHYTKYDVVIGFVTLTYSDGEVVKITLEKDDIAIVAISDPFIQPTTRRNDSTTTSDDQSSEPRTLEILEDVEDEGDRRLEARG